MQVYAAIGTSGAKEMGHIDRKIDGSGLRVAQIGAGIVDNFPRALQIHHGDLARADDCGYCHFRC